MSKKTQKANPEISTVKQAKTIKVKTLIIAIIWLLSLLAAVVGGWTLRSVDNARVSAEAQAIVQLSKAGK